MDIDHTPERDAERIVSLYAMYKGSAKPHERSIGMEEKQRPRQAGKLPEPEIIQPDPQKVLRMRDLFLARTRELLGGAPLSSLRSAMQKRGYDHDVIEAAIAEYDGPEEPEPA